MSIVLPNVRKLLIPDPGYVLFDADLAGADAQVVAWEAEDEDLKAAFRAGLDVHDKNAEDMWGSMYTQLPGDADRGPKAAKRKQTKVCVHLTNYGGTPNAIAMTQGWTRHEAERFQHRWFSMHPKIKTNFHGRVQKALDTNRTVYNRFGFRRVFFDRIDSIFPEALAWIPQSTVALVTYRGAIQLEKKWSFVEMLLQDHDNLVFQLPQREAWTHKDIREGLAVPVPYDDPLTIPWGLASSERSWGHVEKVKEAA